MVTSGTPSEWKISSIDSTGDVGEYSSIAIDSNNKTHISYYDKTNYALKYATNVSGSWITSVIENTNMKYTSIAIDSNNIVHIVYYESVYGDLKYVTNASGSWIISTIDSAGNVGEYPSIAVDSNNKVHISYYDNNSTMSAIKYATNILGSWVTSTIALSDNWRWGYYSSIALDSNNKVHISYCFAYSSSSMAFGTLAYATNVSDVWVTSLIDSSTWGEGVYSSIAIDSNNKAHISYNSNSSGALKYTTNTSSSWNIATIDTNGYFTSIKVDSNNKVHISYSSPDNLKYATNISGLWLTATLAISGNWGLADTSIAIDSNNKAHISYYDVANGDLKYATNQ
ncbi:MAG: hypothetical protein HZA00_02405 [Nitrospinae bacterium]|nr:hypothetical protein [Nitrospinota bacterium]